SDGAKVNVVINAGNGTFVENTSLVSGVQSGAVVEAADYNGDGMPDIIAEGYGEPCFAIYNGSTSVANQAPVAPTSLVMTEGESNVTFTWRAGSDAETPEAALRYNIYVKKTDGTVVTLVNADTETGTLRVADVNASLTTCSYTLNINAADIVAWGVQTIDQAKAASAFATQIEKVPEMVITGHEGYITVSCADGIALGAEDVVANVDNHLEDSYNWESFFTTEVVSETEIKLIPTEDITTAEPPFYLCLVEGYFVLDPNGTKTLSKTLEYYEVDMTIPAEPLTIAYTYPADNAEVESFNNLYIMFNVGDNGIGLYANVAITATSEDGLTTYTGYADYTEDSYQDANVTFAESFAPGKYTITIPAGVFYDYDNKASKNEETKITITVIEPVVSDPMAVVETNPADGASVESFNYMWIKFNMEYGYNSDAEITAVNVNDATVTYTGYPLFYEDWDEEYNQATLEFAESFAPGTYEITIPAGTFWEYGNESNTLGETKFTITVIEPVSGIAGVIADNGVYVVYNLQGVKLMETENVDDLNKLSEGFYIINGSKVAIRK
ncbi:MAG: VCBS repeat-containing protein, partial [Muribaculaceae bacterium]|nr:VCBS repeat-containing protein [Muribaculaceae bacterium]